ncbi:hypothetical protein WN943_025747 [Citrus x changshan-huyou]
MTTFMSYASSSSLILQPLKPSKFSRLSKAKTVTSTIIKVPSSQLKPSSTKRLKTHFKKPPQKIIIWQSKKGIVAWQNDWFSTIDI